MMSGPIEILINNAGIMRRGTMFESSEEDFDRLFRVNVKGSWLLLKLALPRLSKHAMIVQMSSDHARNPVTDPGIYSLSKMAARDLALLAEKTLPGHPVKILYPGPVDTPLARLGVSGTALKRKKKVMRDPGSIAEGIIQLIESDKKELVYDAVSGRYECL
jgi:3-oxoacyl-[acyl-carrier protein] reductase